MCRARSMIRSPIDSRFGSPRSARTYVVIAVAAILMAAAIYLPLSKLVAFTSGPIASGGGGISVGDTNAQVTLGYQADVGTRLGYGQNLLRNTGNSAVRLDSATLLLQSSDPAASVVDVRVAPATEDGSVGVSPWPWDIDGGRRASNATTEPLSGRVIPPKGEVWLIVIIDLEERGRTDWNGIRVDYATEGLFGAKHRAKLSSALSLCAPATNECSIDS